MLSNDPNQYISDNLVPLLLKFKRKCDIWSRLPLSVAGRSNLVKMVWMPQLLYLLHNSPVWIGKKWFQKIQTLFRGVNVEEELGQDQLANIAVTNKLRGNGCSHPYSS